MFGPNLGGVLDVLSTQELLLGVFLSGVGLIFLLFGFRLPSALIAISFGVLGFVLCAYLRLPEDLRLWASLFGGIGLGAASLYFVRLSVALLTGIWAAYAVSLLLAWFEIPHTAVLALCALAFVAGASMTLVAYKEMISLVLSLEGATLIIAGLTIFASRSPALWNHVRDLLLSNAIFAPFLLLAGTVTGFYWQLSEHRERETGMTS